MRKRSELENLGAACKLGEGFLAAQRTLGGRCGDDIGSTDVNNIHKPALDGGRSGRSRQAPHHIDVARLACGRQQGRAFLISR